MVLTSLFSFPNYRMLHMPTTIGVMSSPWWTQVEAIITLANPHIRTLAIVVAGLLIDNHDRTFIMSEITRDRLDYIWELIDEILNALLFMLNMTTI